MQRSTYELVRDQVRAIFHAFTGRVLPDPEGAPAGPVPSEESVLQRFAELEALTRLSPASQAVPPFGFVPRVELLERDGELELNVALHGMRREDVYVEVSGRLLTVSGVRIAERDPLERRLQAEIPRGPFRRTVILPSTVSSVPRVEVSQGLVRIVLSKHAFGTVAQA
jgi:HSP20 family molecular chaperone IbpA